MDILIEIIAYIFIAFLPPGVIGPAFALVGMGIALLKGKAPSGMPWWGAGPPHGMTEGFFPRTFPSAGQGRNILSGSLLFGWDCLSVSGIRSVRGKDECPRAGLQFDGKTVPIL